MSEEEKIERSRGDGKTESREDVSGESSAVSEKPQPTNQQQQTESKEVHYHPDLHHKKKNFREYFFDESCMKSLKSIKI